MNPGHGFYEWPWLPWSYWYRNPKIGVPLGIKWIPENDAHAYIWEQEYDRLDLERITGRRYNMPPSPYKGEDDGT